MGYWGTRGLRGSTFEDMINMSNEVYENKKLAIIQKIPTPITPISIDKSRNAITLGYFEKKSTVDYMGAVQGIPICFDAKETQRKSLPIQNVHEHQINFMKRFEEQKGIAFFLINFNLYGEIYFLPLKKFEIFWNEAKMGGRKSIPYNALKENEIIVGQKKGVAVHYLEALKNYLEKEEKEEKKK